MTTDGVHCMSESVRHFGSFTEARTNFRSVLDAARAGLITTVARGDEQFVVSPAVARSAELRRLLPARAVVVAEEGGGWVALLPGVPVHGDADTFDAAVDDLVEALRDYAADWNERLHAVRNHVEHRSLVELVELSDDGQLRAWLLERADGGSAAPAGLAQA